MAKSDWYKGVYYDPAEPRTVLELIQLQRMSKFGNPTEEDWDTPEDIEKWSSLLYPKGLYIRPQIKAANTMKTTKTTNKGLTAKDFLKNKNYGKK